MGVVAGSWGSVQNGGFAEGFRGSQCLADQSELGFHRLNVDLREAELMNACSAEFTAAVV